MNLHRRGLLAFAALSVLALLQPARAADPVTFSEAERLLFTTDHFKSLSNETQLDYEYRKRGSLEQEFVDRVRVNVGTRRAGGGHDTKVDFLSGKEKLALPDVKDAEGNPLILHFLEREVREMNRLTGGSSNYFRKRIRMALAGAAEVRPVTLSVAGKRVQAREIHIAPYRDDPARSRYEKFAEKTFVLTLSDQVPGGVVEMRSQLMQAVPGADPTLVLAESVKYIGPR